MQKTIFLVSDSTGITAEAFGSSMINQFNVNATFIRMPFVDSIDKAYDIIQKINKNISTTHDRPIIFATVIDRSIIQLIQTSCDALVIDTFGVFLAPLEKELGQSANKRVGRFNDIAHSQTYNARIDAINFSLEHDDGQTDRNLALSDVILIGVSRSGKTPTSLYLAMQYGVKTANYPLIPEDFERDELPTPLVPYQKKLFGLSIDPYRLAEIRNERRPNSKYASIENCKYEVAQSEHMMRTHNVQWLSTTNRSIEEISSTILQEIKLNKFKS